MQSSGTVFSSITLPIEIREPIATIQLQFATTGIDTPFSFPTLPYLGAPADTTTASLILSPFQALPFAEPLTGLVNARNRWYETSSGTFVSPDPLGNIDSANLYAFAGGDPVNGRDPTGEISLKAALTDSVINEYEMSTLELTDDEIRTIIGSQSALKLAGADDPLAAKHNLTRAKFILLARNPAFRAYTQELYELTRDVNPTQFEGEAINAIVTGREPVLGNKIRRGDKAFQLVTYLAFTKGTQKGTQYVLGELRAGALFPRTPMVKKPPLVIGEGMRSRVIPYAKSIGADYYGGAGPNVPEVAYLEHNREVIRIAMDEGREIIDIGPNPTGPNHPESNEPELRHGTSGDCTSAIQELRAHSE
jgi:RHS repeat-associated protein